jgi:hypothetical protein
MEALKKGLLVDPEGFIKVPVLPSFGRQVEIIALPYRMGKATMNRNILNAWPRMARCTG